MKLYLSVLPILSAVLFVPNQPNGMAIMHQGNVGTDVPRVSDHSFDSPVRR